VETRYELVANVSLLFGELPLFERFAAAADAGFGAVELWWPFDGPRPGDAEVAALLAAVEAAGVRLAGMNLWGGDQPAGERGTASHPDRRADFDAAVEVMAGIAERTGLRITNALYGQRRPEFSAAEQDEAAVDALAAAARRLGPLGVTVVVEPLSRGLNGDYPILTAADAVAVARRASAWADGEPVRLLFDTFHLANNGEDLVAVVRQYADEVGHVQLADTPGRGEPGSGGIDFAAVLDALAEAGYAGEVAAEYAPTAATADTLGWTRALPHVRLG
jgi:hydroxypyruvate isomerase